MRGFEIPIAPEGTVRRIFFGLATVSLLVASFLFSTIFPSTAFAASVDISWVSNNTKISYQSHEYAKLSATDAAKVPNADTGKYDYYQWINTSPDPDQAQVVAVDKGKQPKTGNFEIYTYDKSTYTAISTDEDASSCNIFGNMGWILCSVSSGLSAVVDQIYGIIKDFMDVTLFTGKATVAYDMWNYVRVIANVCFVIVFLVIIYSQITGLGISNYGIKSMIPRLLTAAILVNISYWICSLAVDASNLMGHSVYGVFQGLQEAMTSDLSGQTGNVGWEELRGAVVAGGATTVIAGYAFSMTAGASIGFMLVSLLIVVAFAALIALVILAARQALILVFTVLSPLAFIAMVLPKTRDWFDKWMKQFTSLLIFFPMFSLLFGASQVAGQAIIASQIGDATSSGGLKIHMILFGLGIQCIPLVFTPWLIKLSNGILGQVANMVNKGLQKPQAAALGWAKRQREYQAERAALRPFQFKNDKGVKGGINKAIKGVNKVTQTPSRFVRRTQMHQDEMSNVQKELMKNNYHTSNRGKWSDELRRSAGAEHDAIEAEHDKHWNSTVSQARSAGNKWQHRRDLREKTHENKGLAKIIDESMTDTDELAFQRRLNTSNELAGYRAMQVNSAVDKAQAEIHANEIKSVGTRAAQTRIINDRDLQRRFNTAHQNEQVATSLQNTIKSSAEASYDNLKLTDASVQSISLTEQQISKQAARAKAEWETLIANIQAQGAKNIPHLDAANAQIADTIMQDTENVKVEEMAKVQAENVLAQNFAKALKASQGVAGGQLERAAGIDPRGASAVLARAKSEFSSGLIKDIDNLFNTMDYGIKGNAKEAYKAFETATDIQDQIAYMMTFATQGTAGDENLRKATLFMEEKYANRELTDDEMRDFKDLAMSKVSNLKNQGEDMKRYYGTADQRYKALVTDPEKSWLKSSPGSFAQASPIAQIQTLKAFAAKGDDRFNNFIQNLSPADKSMLKDEDVVKLIKMSASEVLANAPTAYDEYFK